MKSYCLKYRIDTENIDPRISDISNGKKMLLLLFLLFMLLCVQNVVVQNEDLLKINMQKDY